MNLLFISGALPAPFSLAPPALRGTAAVEKRGPSFNLNNLSVSRSMAKRASASPWYFMKAGDFSGVTRDINRLRQRKSAKYALEWLERIRQDFRLESSEMEKLKEHQNYFPELQTLRGSLSKVDMQDCSAKNYGKYRENLRDSRKMRSEINDSFLRYWNPSQAVEAGKLANESRHLVPAKKGKIFRYKQERIELLSVDEMVTPERSDPNNQHRKNSLDLCNHPLLQPFLAEQVDGQKAITMDGVSGEAVVIYRRKERRQLQDWKNYQIEQFTFGKTELSLDTMKKRSSSEPRETSPQKQVCVTRRRRSKFHYEPVKLDRSVSIEFKKFDEIQEVLHPEKTVPCKKCDNARVWKSNEFRLRSSAKMKLNLFKEMKKKERYRQKKFEETVARSLNCGLYENFNRRLLLEGDEKAKEIVPEEESPKVPCSESPAQAGASPEERVDEKTLGMPVEKRSNRECDTKSLSQEALQCSTVSELGKVSAELAADELIGSTEAVSGNLQEGNSRSVTNATFNLGTNVSNPGEVESLTLQVENVLQDSSHELHLDSSVAEETFKPQDYFPEERSLVMQVMPVLLYPSTVRSRGIAENFTEHKSGSAQKLRDSSLRDLQLRQLMARQRNKTATLGSGKLFTSKSESSDFHKRSEPGENSTSKESLTSSELENPKKHRCKYRKTLSTPGRSESSSLITGRCKGKSLKNHAKSCRSTPSEARDTESVANKSTRIVEKRITRLEGKLKGLLRRIGICPIREQETIKNCLERLKEASEAALRRLTRIEYCTSGSFRCPAGEECSVGIYRKSSCATERGYSSEPDTSVNVNRKCKPIILKTSESEIQLNVGMEITMENFDPVTGEKLNPETNREFEQQGNISCKLLKPGEKPVTFIDTDFLYNPKTGEYVSFTMRKVNDAEKCRRCSRPFFFRGAGLETVFAKEDRLRMQTRFRNALQAIDEKDREGGRATENDENVPAFENNRIAVSVVPGGELLYREGHIVHGAVQPKLPSGKRSIIERFQTSRNVSRNVEIRVFGPVQDGGGTGGNQKREDSSRGQERQEKPVGDKEVDAVYANSEIRYCRRPQAV